MLVVYRDAQHPATVVTPYRAMFNKPIWRKHEHIIIRLKRTKQQEMMDEKDMLYKDKMKRSGLNIKEHGQYVRLKQKKGKWWLAYINQFSTQLSLSVAVLPLEDEWQMEQQYAETRFTLNWSMELYMRTRQGLRRKCAGDTRKQDRRWSNYWNWRIRTSAARKWSSTRRTKWPGWLICNRGFKSS